jgi:hypothetical protein
MSVINATCFGANNGKFQIKINAPIAGTPRFWIDIKLNTNTITNLANPTTGQSATLTGQPSGVPSSAVGFNNNGVYAWDNLVPGTYTFTIWDTNGECPVTDEFTINEPTSLKISTDVSVGQCTGNATVIVEAAGGTPPYKYYIRSNEDEPDNPVNNPATGEWNTTYFSDDGVFTSIPVVPTSQAAPNRKYHVYVQDANGCWFNNLNPFTNVTNIKKTTVAGYTVDVDYQTAYSFTTAKKDATCFNSCDGEIDVIILGQGTPPYKIILTGLSADGNPVALTNDCEETACPTSYKFTGLCASFHDPENLTSNEGYVINVYDANNCPAAANGTVIDINSPAAIEVAPNPTIVDVSCAECCDGSVTFTGIKGGCKSDGQILVSFIKGPEGVILPTPIYLNQNLPNGATYTEDALAPGAYEVSFTDECGCSKIVRINIRKTPGINIQ